MPGRNEKRGTARLPIMEAFSRSDPPQVAEAFSQNNPNTSGSTPRKTSNQNPWIKEKLSDGLIPRYQHYS
jgi:hypothetical protein